MHTTIIINNIMYFRTLAREQGRPRGTQTSLVIGTTMFAIKLLFNQLKSEERLTISINIIFQSQGIDFGCSKQIIRKQLSEILFIHSFIHSGHFYSAPSSPLLLRGAPDYSTDTVSEFHAEAHRQLHVK